MEVGSNPHFFPFKGGLDVRRLNFPQIQIFNSIPFFSITIPPNLPPLKKLH